MSHKDDDEPLIPHDPHTVPLSRSTSSQNSPTLRVSPQPTPLHRASPATSPNSSHRPPSTASGEREDHYPLELFPASFLFSASKQASGYVSRITVRNRTSTVVMYKFKTNAPKRYLVKPVQGSLQAGAALDVFVRCDGEVQFTDRFMIQTIRLSSAEKAAHDISLTTFLQAIWKSVETERIQVKFVDCIPRQVQGRSRRAHTVSNPMTPASVVASSVHASDAATSPSSLPATQDESGLSRTASFASMRSSLSIQQEDMRSLSASETSKHKLSSNRSKLRPMEEESSLAVLTSKKKQSSGSSRTTALCNSFLLAVTFLLIGLMVPASWSTSFTRFLHFMYQMISGEAQSEMVQVVAQNPDPTLTAE